jgi:ankyrin repeat protein
MNRRFILTALLLPILAIGFCCMLISQNLYHSDPFYKAIMRGDVTAVQSCLREHPDEINGLIGYATPLDLAAEKNDTNMIAFLLDQGAEIEDKQGYRNLCTALHCAASHGNIDAIAFLLSHGAYVNSIDRDNETPLHYAATNDHAEAVTYLIAHGANINAHSTDYDRTPLEEAVRYERLQAARVLLEHGAEADFDKLIASIKSDMAGAPLASQADRDKWLKTIAMLQEFKDKRRVH